MNKESNNYQICSKGIWDTSVPGIVFNDSGESNYYQIQMNLMKAFPRGERGRLEWENIVEDAKKEGGGKKYDCIVGVSGGVDSSYLLYLIKEKYKLRPLAVNLDNGWSSDIAVKNIKKITSRLDIDLETYVIDYEEIKNILRAYMRAGLPWVDGPSDMAIKAVMFKYAMEEGVKYVFRGNDFRSEGKQPREWTYTDLKALKYILKKFGDIKQLKTFPKLTLFKLFYCSTILKIRDLRPYYFLEYTKEEAKIFLEKNFNWEYYGGHHHENLLTKFVMSYWLPKKFGIDKRIINLSAQVIAGTMKREEALEIISKASLEEKDLNELKFYVLKKLDIKTSEFDKIMADENKYYYNYPSYLPFILKFSKLLLKFSSLFNTKKPMSFFEIEGRK